MEEIKEFARSMGHSPYTNLKYRRHLPPSNDTKVGDGVEEIQSTQEAVDDENDSAERNQVLQNLQQQLEDVMEQIANNDASIEAYYRLTLSPDEDDEDSCRHFVAARNGFIDNAFV